MDFRIGAIRELFEETGVRSRRGFFGGDLSLSGSQVLLSDPQLRDASHLKEARARLQKDSNLFLEICQQQKLLPDVGRCACDFFRKLCFFLCCC